MKNGKEKDQVETEKETEVEEKETSTPAGESQEAESEGEEEPEDDAAGGEAGEQDGDVEADPEADGEGPGDVDDAQGEEEPEEEEDDDDLDLEDLEDVRPSRSEAGAEGGGRNQLSPEMRALAKRDPEAFAEMVREGQAARRTSIQEKVNDAVEELLEEFPRIPEQNRAFFRKMADAIGRNVEGRVRGELKSRAVAERRQTQVREGMARLRRLPEWKTKEVQRSFWGEIALLKAQGKWARPEVVAARIGLALDGRKKVGPAKVKEAGRRQVEEEVRREAPKTKPATKKATTALDDWLATEEAKAIDRRARRGG